MDVVQEIQQVKDRIKTVETDITSAIEELEAETANYKKYDMRATLMR